MVRNLDFNLKYSEKNTIIIMKIKWKKNWIGKNNTFLNDEIIYQNMRRKIYIYI